MNRKGRQALVLAAGACSVLLVLGISAAAALAAAGPRPSAQGITVYGRWTVTVRDRNGHRVARRFENTLLDDGQVFLTKLLTRSVTIGPWQIELLQGGYAQTISEPGAANHVDASTLTASTRSTLSTGGPNVLVLQGSFQPSTAATYTGVATQNNVCSADDPVSSCSPTPFVQYLTRATLDPPIAVAAGDTIGVHVEISFGAAPETPATTTTTKATTTTTTTTKSVVTTTKPKTGIAESNCLHSDGFGGKYTDCADPLHTYSEATAMDAATEVAPGKIAHDFDCSSASPLDGRVVMVTNNGTEYFWIYTGALAGKAGSIASSAGVIIRYGVKRSSHMDPLGPGGSHPSGGCGVMNLMPLLPGAASKAWT